MSELELIEVMLEINPNNWGECQYKGGEFSILCEFAKAVADNRPHWVNVAKTYGITSSLIIDYGRYGMSVTIVMPKEKLERIIVFAEPLRRILLAEDDTDYMDALTLLYDGMYDILVNEENYVDVSFKLEHDEAEGLKVHIEMYETFG